MDNKRGASSTKKGAQLFATWVHVQRDFHLPLFASSQGFFDMCGVLFGVLRASMLPFCMRESMFHFYLGSP